jgi:hypothetical protein
MNSSGFNLDSRCRKPLLRARTDSFSASKTVLMLFDKVGACSAINPPELKIKGAFPLQKHRTFEKKSYL